MYGTPKDVIDLTGVSPNHLGLENAANPDLELQALLTTWLKRVKVAIDARLNQGAVGMNEPNYEGIVDVSVRTVTRMVELSIYQRNNGIINVNDTYRNYQSISSIMDGLDDELKPYQDYSSAKGKTRVNLFLS